MPSGKAAGADGLTVEMLKAGGQTAVRFLTFICNALIDSDGCRTAEPVLLVTVES